MPNTCPVKNCGYSQGRVATDKAPSLDQASQQGRTHTHESYSSVSVHINPVIRFHLR